MMPLGMGYMNGNDDVECWNSTSDSLIRNQLERDSGPRNLRGEEPNYHSLDREIRELLSRSRSQEEEILVLRKQIADASLREVHLLNEKHILERTLSELRMVLDEKQIDVISDAMRELTRRKDYLEENLRLSNDIKVTEEEIHIFTSSLLNVLADFSIRPPVINASTIVSGTKHLYHHMNWKIRPYELKYNHYQSDNRLESTSNRLGAIRDHMMDTTEANVASSPDMQYSFTNETMGKPLASMYRSKKDEFEVSFPGIEGFQIVGEPKPGYTLRACGYPTHGTSLCIFQWFRHLQNGTRELIEGATVPDYVVTPDDVDTYIAVDCIPMDDQGRQGELVSCFANNQNKITCDSDMQHEIDTHISAGRATFNVLLWRDSSENWEQSILILKRSSWQIKVNHIDEVIMDEKYSPDLNIRVPPGVSVQFVLISSEGVSLPLSTERTSQPYSSENDIRLRDIIVLTMRSFQTKALDGKKKSKV